MALNWMLLLILNALFLLHFWFNRRLGERDPLTPASLFLYYFYMQFVLYSVHLFLGAKPEMPWTDLTNPAIVEQHGEALLLAILGLVCFSLGYFGLPLLSLRGRSEAASLSRPRLNLEPHRTLTVAIGLAGISAFTLIAFLRSMGGIKDFLLQLGTWRSLGVMGSGVYIIPIKLATDGGILYFCWTLMTGPSRRRNLIAATIFTLSILPTALLGFRVGLVPQFLQFLIIWHLAYRKLTWQRIGILATFALLGLSVFGVIRAKIEGHRFDFELSNLIEDNPLVSVVRRVPGVEIVAPVVDELRYTHDFAGWSDGLFEAATIIVPRQVWEDKPTPQGIKFGRKFFSDFLLRRDGYIGESTGGFSPTAIGFFYWQQGIIGIIVGMILLGLAAKAIESLRRLGENGNLFYLLIYAGIAGQFAVFMEAPQDSMNTLILRVLTFAPFLLLCTSHRVARETPLPQPQDRLQLDH
jgi:hypothetical protein